MKSLLVVTPCLTGGLPTQSSLIARRLRDAGVRVGMFPKAPSGIGRLIETLVKSVWLMARYDAVLIDVFGERAFVYESFAIVWARLCRRRLHVVLRNGMLPDFLARWPRWSKFILSLPDHVYTPHQFLTERLAEAAITVDRVIPNFIDLEKYSYRERSTLRASFLYLRGLHPVSNPEMALRAFALIQKSHPNASITMAGREGPDSERCRQLVGELGLHHVRFIGLVRKGDIPALADQHDIHMHTNRFDNMPVTVIEMWACGLPIVGTNVGGMPYLVRDGVDGLLVPTEDHQAMASACLELLSNPDHSARLSRAGRVRAEELAWARVEPIWRQVLFGDTQPIRVESAAAKILPTPRIER
jgi:glycosyltransferase involved in cell wall biosynthesis